jgi:hypothetical protein
MVETIVRELSDGEELVLEGVPAKGVADDPRERAIEVRSLAGRSLAQAEGRPVDGSRA